MLQSSLKTMEKATSLVTSDSLNEKSKFQLSGSGKSYLFASLVLLLILLKMSVLKPSRTSLISLISYLSDPLKIIHQQIFWNKSDMYGKAKNMLPLISRMKYLKY